MPTETEKLIHEQLTRPKQTGSEQTRKLAREFIRPQTSPAQLDEPPKENENASAGHNHLAGAALRAYNKQVKKQQEDRMIVEYLPMVHKIVNQVITYLHPPLSIEDLISAGTIGLVKAARDFDPTQETEFKTYAYIRVKGAVIDELRGWSFAPSSLKKQLEAARKAFLDYKNANGKEPTDTQLAKHLGIPVEKLYKIFENARARHFLSIHGIDDDAPALGDSLRATNVDQPGDNLEREELLRRMTDAIQDLPDKLRKIIILYYHKELTMKEVASLMNVTESRVSQLHAAALFKLSSKLRNWDESGS